jgi:hypothetical protein
MVRVRVKRHKGRMNVRVNAVHVWVNDRQRKWEKPLVWIYDEELKG